MNLLQTKYNNLLFSRAVLHWFAHWSNLSCTRALSMFAMPRPAKEWQYLYAIKRLDCSRLLAGSIRYSELYMWVKVSIHVDRYQLSTINARYKVSRHAVIVCEKCSPNVSSIGTKWNPKDITDRSGKVDVGFNQLNQYEGSQRNYILPVTVTASKLRAYHSMTCI